MSYVKIKSNSTENIKGFHEQVLTAITVEDVDYCANCVEEIIVSKTIDPQKVYEKIKHFDFDIDTIDSVYKRQGLIYTEKHCLHWQILYKDIVGNLLKDWNAVLECEKIEPYIYVELKRELTSNDTTHFWLNTTY